MLSRSYARISLSLMVLTMLFACSRAPDDRLQSDTEPRLTAKTLGTQNILTRDEYLSLPEYRDADPDYGLRLSMQCRACHSLDAGGPQLIGPNLHGFFGRPAGSVAGFPYSRAMRSVDFTWTPRALDAWLASPGDFLPGSSMSYAGLPNESDRRALIASLLRQTSE